MAVQAGLLNAQIPMQAKFTPPDPVNLYVQGVETKGHLQDLQIQNEERENTIKDHKVIQDYLSTGGGDLYTLPGQEKAVNDLKGKISSKSYMGLVDHTQKSKVADLKMRDDMTKMTADQLKLRDIQFEKGMGYMAQPLQVYDEAVKSKGQQGAAADFEMARTQIVGAAQSEKLPDGSPAFPPAIIDQLSKATPEQLKHLMATTKYQKDVNLQHLQESQIRRNDALAGYDQAREKATAEGRGTGGTPTAIAKNDADLKAGRITPEEHGRIKASLIEKAAKNPNISGLTPDAVDRAANDYYIDGTMPARLNPMERAIIMNRAAEIATGAGDNSEAGTIRKAANKANKAALGVVTRQEQMTSVFERDAEKRLDLVLGLAKKADLSGSPALNRWIRAGRQNIEGDADVNNLNSAMISLQAELAKVLSGALGNAGVSDAARAEAAQIINSNMSMEQLNSLAPNIRKELHFKLDSFKEQRKSLEDSLRVPGGGPTLRKGDDQAHDKGLDTGDDKGRIYKQEYAAAKERLSKAADPDVRKRAQGDLDALARDAKAAGVKLDDAPAAATKSSKPPPSTNSKGWTLHKDKNGNYAYVGPNKEIEEVK